MADISRQEVAFIGFKNDFLRLVLQDKKMDTDTKKAIQAEFTDITEHPGISNNLIQAFSNFMWYMDFKIETEVNNELVNLMAMIPKMADPEDKNTLTIMDALNKIIVENRRPTVDLEEVAINQLVGDDEVDDSPIEL